MYISLEIEAKALNKTIEYIDEVTRNKLEFSIANLAKSVEAKAHELAHQKLQTTLQDYLNSLSLEGPVQNGSIILYTLTLANEASWIENGGPQAGFDIKPGVLRGPRRLHISKDGKRYKHVPFSHRPYSKVTLGGVRGEVQKNLQSTMQKYSLNKILKATGNKAMQGRMTNQLKSEIRQELHPHLQGLRKYTHPFLNKKTGKITQQSIYRTFRTISENSPSDSWIIRDPWAGAKIFPELKTYIRDEMKAILTDIL